MRPRRSRPLFLIDIALPRDVEAAVGEPRPGVPLQHRRPPDDREGEPRAAHARSSTRAERIVGRKSSKFIAWMQSREIIPTVVALRQRFEAIRQAELTRLEAEARRPAARGPGARRRNHAPHRREAPADADRTAQVGQRRSHGDHLRGRAEPAVQPRVGTRPRRASPGAARRRRDAPAPARHARQPARAVAGAHRRRRCSSARGTPSSSSSSRRRAIGCRKRRSRRSAASGCSSRKSRTRCCAATSTSPCTARRTCRPSCRMD